MSECFHKNLTLIRAQTKKLRCEHCHLTISPDELEEGYCPECYESTGQKKTDFKEVPPEASNKSQYICDDCQITITVQN